MFFKEQGIGHLFNKYSHKENGPKGQGNGHIVKRKGYGSEFQYKLAGLMTYISPHFLKFQIFLNLLGLKRRR